jgi:hypothetical protein
MDSKKYIGSSLQRAEPVGKDHLDHLQLLKCRLGGVAGFANFRRRPGDPPSLFFRPV